MRQAKIERKRKESGETDGRAATDFLNMERRPCDLLWRGGRKGVAGVMLA